jgi:hypothetical protein
MLPCLETRKEKRKKRDTETRENGGGKNKTG